MKRLMIAIIILLGLLLSGCGCTKPELVVPDYTGTEYEQATAYYEWVKEEVEYRFSHWGTPEDTLKQGCGHCGVKAELLGDILSDRGMDVRFVEGRPSFQELIITKTAFMDLHIWLEVYVDGDWLTLDPTPDSGIVCLLGDTVPGSHLNDTYITYIVRWDEIPYWYREGYNDLAVVPLMLITNAQIDYHRMFKCGN